MMTGKKNEYQNFDALSKAEREGINFRICVGKKKSSVSIIAPHGGNIEPKTSLIAAAIAGSSFNLYCFDGLKSARADMTLHITSHVFDEPKCLALISACDAVVSVHGLCGKGKTIEVGGLDFVLRDQVCRHLKLAGFKAKAVNSGNHAAISKSNICNRGRSAKGIQLEITRGLRDTLNGPRLAKFANAVREAIKNT